MDLKTKQFFLISRFMLFSTLKNIEKCPFTYWLNGRWFLQIVESDIWNLYTLYTHILYSLVLILYLKLSFLISFRPVISGHYIVGYQRSLDGEITCPPQWSREWSSLGPDRSRPVYQTNREYV